MTEALARVAARVNEFVLLTVLAVFGAHFPCVDCAAWVVNSVSWSPLNSLKKLRSSWNGASSAWKTLFTQMVSVCRPVLCWGAFRVCVWPSGVLTLRPRTPAPSAQPATQPLEPLAVKVLTLCRDNADWAEVEEAVERWMHRCLPALTPLWTSALCKHRAKSKARLIILMSTPEILVYNTKQDFSVQLHEKYRLLSKVMWSHWPAWCLTDSGWVGSPSLSPHSLQS